ncbi:hypothetical protein ACFZA4_18435 [Streptomyces antimycoticus]|uniref:hypothetical protein n=1 Tax=Streptomyces antimycoticus TaxID=68175 RepID=UPI0036E2DE69|nr:hypothetical protein OG546_40650 [Streptomyces antimycoticus]
MTRCAGEHLSCRPNVACPRVRGSGCAPLLVPAAMRLLGRSAWYAPGFLRTVHGRFGLSEGGPAPAPGSMAEPPYAEDSTRV